MSVAQLVAGGCLAGALVACAPAPPQVPAEFRPDVRRAGRVCDAVTPKLIAAQLHQESGWDPRAVSPAGAQGLAQFMPETWARWGADLDGDGHADPFDPAEAIDAQGRLMCFLVDQARASGIAERPVVLALAAYNAGWGPVAQHRGVPPFPETRDYVDLVLALADRIQVRPKG